MLSVSLIVIVTMILFFLVYFLGTQEIYSKNVFNFLLTASILFSTAIYFLVDKIHRFDAVNIGLVFLHYTLMLILIKKFYRLINQFLIKKKLIKPNYTTKDFTHVIWDDTPGVEDTWDENLATEPSRLDYFFSYLLLILPILISILIGSFV